ncbi:peptidase inhibitor family I36 protein [Streptomyces sp. NPDC089919]|uniref:peptidase inhibitor family I36 protein n=1 Tax=Streptomyces sp. NPDC089919 TaxID=3155188 RepID=UPI003448A685
MRTFSSTLAVAVLAGVALAGAALLPGASTAQARPAVRTTTTAQAPAAGRSPAAPAPPGRVLGACAPGQLCLWGKPGFQGTRTVHELSSVDLESCTALPAGKTVQALANRMRRPVTTYESAVCAETGEFQTYPGDGVWLPESPYQVRAFKVWER